MEGHEAVRLSERDGAHVDGFGRARLLLLATSLLRNPGVKLPSGVLAAIPVAVPLARSLAHTTCLLVLLRRRGSGVPDGRGLWADSSSGTKPTLPTGRLATAGRSAPPATFVKLLFFLLQLGTMRGAGDGGGEACRGPFTPSAVLVFRTLSSLHPVAV